MKRQSKYIRHPKLNSERNDHDQYLENLIYHLGDLGEKDINWIMKDGYWRKENEGHQISQLCDLLVVKFDNIGVPMELKGSKNSRCKAKKQILMGREFMEDVLNLSVAYGKIIVYSPEAYFTKDYYYKNDKWDNWKKFPFRQQ